MVRLIIDVTASVVVALCTVAANAELSNPVSAVCCVVFVFRALFNVVRVVDLRRHFR